MFWLATGILVLVLAVLVIGLFRPRRDEEGGAVDLRTDKLFIWAGGIIIPLIVLGIVYIFALRGMNLLAVPSDLSDDHLVIEVTGHQWWWEVHYPEQDVTLANELHIPVNELVELKVMSADVIHCSGFLAILRFTSSLFRPWA